MQSLTQFINNLSMSNPMVWAGLAGVIMIVLGALLWGRARFLAPVVETRYSTFQANAAPAPASLSERELTRADERRRTMRRGGLPTPIQIADPKDVRKPTEGFVLDRSSGGLRVAVQKPLPTGGRVQVRPQHAPDNTPWVTVIIRNCREVGDYFEVGCQFEGELPWNLLLQFG